MRKKAISVLIAIALIVIIGGASLGKLYIDKYSYSMERADLDAYFGVSGEELAIVLQDELVEEKGLLRDGSCYLDLDTVHKYLNEIFYADMTEGLLLYALPTEVVSAHFGESTYSTAAGGQELGSLIAFAEGEKLYVSLDYVKLFTNFGYEVFDRHIQLNTEWGMAGMSTVSKDTWIRERGGVKSPILRDVAAGENVEILERLENWSRVKTSDAFIGYIENKRLGPERMVEETPVTDYVEPEYSTIHMDKKVSLGFHAVGGAAGNTTLNDMVAGTKGLNVVAPTWFSLTDAAGYIRNFGAADYVSNAHGKGLQVWAVLDDFNYCLENGIAAFDLEVLSSTTARSHLVQSAVDAAVGLGVDGINVDFEKVSAEAGEHYVQFLRELSVQCRNCGLVLSVDNYVPLNFNNYYRLDVQGKIVDYCIIMGYDEHWHGCGDPGSVASIGYVSGGLERTLASVPADKVINALPFYTIIWKTEGDTVTDEYLIMNKQDSYLAGVNAQIVWDEETAQNYAEWTVGEATYRIWLEDADSIGAKLTVMNADGIAGVAVWRLGYGTSTVWDLLNAYTSTGAQ